ncbi:hypothetical protein R8Z50_18740 [Longispora sp. K20-0274]|uniref:hypothetical protein n=1 Tax=Longispora sp. K20-0274 TaxID=3088255 RepID=UPI00399A726D
MSTTQRYQAAEKLLRRPARPGELVVGDRIRPQWIDGGARFWYGVNTGSGRRFVAAGKGFEMFIVPGAEHVFFDCIQFVRTLGWDFLVRELLGGTPPAYRPAPIEIDGELLGELFA